MKSPKIAVLLVFALFQVQLFAQLVVKPMSNGRLCTYFENYDDDGEVTESVLLYCEGQKFTPAGPYGQPVLTYKAYYNRDGSIDYVHYYSEDNDELSLRCDYSDKALPTKCVWNDQDGKVGTITYNNDGTAHLVQYVPLKTGIDKGRIIICTLDQARQNCWLYDINSDGTYTVVDSGTDDNGNGIVDANEWKFEDRTPQTVYLPKTHSTVPPKRSSQRSQPLVEKLRPGKFTIGPYFQ